MKRIAIIRHAKSEQQNYDRDFERQLVKRGIDDARRLAEELKALKIFPDKIISSPATRALQTALIFAEGLAFPPEQIEEQKGLYFDYTTSHFIDLLHQTDDGVQTLFLFGHNPFMHYMAQNMSSDYDGHMPTSSTVVLDFEVEAWKEIEARQGKLFVHLYPGKRS
jgi:phosphohistidine phosphatase